MNSKENCLAYAREKLPRLMELSFGCEVRIREKLDTCTHYATATVIHKWIFSDEVVVRGVFISEEYKGKDAVRVPTEYISKIIGHIPQLQDWLELLGGNKGRGLYVDTDGDVFDIDDEGSPPFLTFNLTTGQPATDEDWNSLAELLGLNEKQV
jgi:hypothetical protein